MDNPIALLWLTFPFLYPAYRLLELGLTLWKSRVADRERRLDDRAVTPLIMAGNTLRPGTTRWRAY